MTKTKGAGKPPPDLSPADIFLAHATAMSMPLPQFGDKGRMGLKKPLGLLAETPDQRAIRRAEAIKMLQVVFGVLSEYFTEHEAREMFAEGAKFAPGAAPRRPPGPKKGESRDPDFDRAMLRYFDERAAAEPHLIKNLPGIVAAELKRGAEMGTVNERFTQRISSAQPAAVEEHLRRLIRRRDKAAAQYDELVRLTGPGFLADAGKHKP